MQVLCFVCSWFAAWGFIIITLGFHSDPLCSNVTIIIKYRLKAWLHHFSLFLSTLAQTHKCEWVGTQWKNLTLQCQHTCLNDTHIYCTTWQCNFTTFSIAVSLATLNFHTHTSVMYILKLHTYIWILSFLFLCELNQNISTLWVPVPGSMSFHFQRYHTYFPSISCLATWWDSERGRLIYFTYIAWDRDISETLCTA